VEELLSSKLLQSKKGGGGWLDPARHRKGSGRIKGGHHFLATGAPDVKGWMEKFLLFSQTKEDDQLNPRQFAS
jgi:hypothetical protein